MAAPSVSASINLDGTPEGSKLDQDYKRDADHRHKYALGSVDVGQKIVPGQPISQRTQRRLKRYTQRDHKHAMSQNKSSGKHPTLDHDTTTSDSSAEEDIKEASAAPVPDADVAYSFDARRGPSHGSEILSMAISKAVERFENKETEKLVKDEYEVVAREKEVETRNAGYVADEDDFELVLAEA